MWPAIRCHFVRALLLFTLSCLSATPCLAGSGVETGRPNIVLIYTDDQGYGDASCLNPQSRFQTPHLDRLAATGILFTDAHSPDTVCTPSRYGLLTGRYCWRTTLKRGVFGAESPCLIPDDRWTLASMLKQHGYRTAMIGKWHLGMDFPGEFGNRDWQQPVRDMPLDKGFDDYYGIPASMNYGVLAWFEGRFAVTPPTRYTAKKPNQRAISDYRIAPPYEPSADRVQAGRNPRLEVAPDFVDQQCLTRFTQRTVEWLTNYAHESHESPFFLYLALTSPHKPVVPLPKYQGQGKAGAYGEFMIETDDHVGTVMATLNRLGLSENTLVIVTSDNGPENTWGERKRRFGHASNGPFRDGKRSIYEGGHRVPLIVCWPAGIHQPGRRCEVPICQTDILATLAEMLRIDLPDSAGEDSHSFFPVLGNPAAALPERSMVHHAANGRFALRSQQWKLVMPWRRQAAELYDLSQDPGEANDLARQFPGVVQQLQEKLTQAVTSGRTTAGTQQPNDTGYWDDLTWLERRTYQQLTDSN